MNVYEIFYYNRFVNETQSIYIRAKNEFRAGRLFYKLRNRKSYHKCIENIIECNYPHIYTEEEIMMRMKQ